MALLSGTTIFAWTYFPHKVLADVAISAALPIAFRTLPTKCSVAIS